MTPTIVIGFDAAAAAISDAGIPARWQAYNRGWKCPMASWSSLSALRQTGNTVTRKDDRIVSIIWHVDIKPGVFGEFSFIARNPQDRGQLVPSVPALCGRQGHRLYQPAAGHLSGAGGEAPRHPHLAQVPFLA
jgi:hypothetical protein